MLVHIIFIFLPLLFHLLIKDNKRFHVIMFISLFLFLSLRAFSVGGDLENYKLSYDYVYCSPLRMYLLKDMKEPLFQVFARVCWILSSGSFRFFLVACALVFSWMVSFAIFRISRKQWLSWFCFIAMSNLVYGLSGLRSSFGLVFGICATLFLFDPNKVEQSPSIAKYLLFCTIATLFHYTALIYFLIWPAMIVRTRNKKVYYSFFVLFVVFLIVFGDRIFPFLASVFFPSKEYVFSSDGGWGLLLIVLVLRIGLAAFVPIQRHDYEYVFIITVLELTMVSQILAFQFNLWARISQFLFALCLIYLPNILSQMVFDNVGKKAVIPIVIIVILFAFYCRELIADSAGIVPYLFFWQSAV